MSYTYFRYVVTAGLTSMALPCFGASSQLQVPELPSVPQIEEDKYPTCADEAVTETKRQLRSIKVRRCLSKLIAFHNSDLQTFPALLKDYSESIIALEVNFRKSEASLELKRDFRQKVKSEVEKCTPRTLNNGYGVHWKTYVRLIQRYKADYTDLSETRTSLALGK